MIHGNRFDSVTMIDVLEHFPRQRWSNLFSRLDELMTGSRKIFITTPTYLHQEWLAQNDPKGLQVVDETVYLDDLIALCARADLKPSYFEQVSIWKTNDYSHFFAERNQDYLSVTERKSHIENGLRKVSSVPSRHSAI